MNKKKIIIFGANGLIGLNLTNELLKNDYIVIAVDLEFTNFTLNLKNNKNLFFKKINVSHEKKLIDFLKRENDIIGVVNSLYLKNSNYGKKVEDVSSSSFAENITINLKVIFNIYKISYQNFLKFKKPINIISIASIYSFMTPKFDIYKRTNMTMPIEYAAYKASLVNINKYFSKYVRNKNFRCNCISPGGIDSDQPKIFKRQYSKYTISNKMINVMEIIPTIVFLLSKGSSKINGQNIIIDDGFSN